MWRFWIPAALLMTALVVPAVCAQETSAPLIIRAYEGALLVYDGTSLERMDFCVPDEGETYSGFPLMFAPDATRFAYLALTGSGNLSRIYVCDLSERALVPVEGQDDARIRSIPAWSPDGTRIAWNQVEESGANLQTVVYDFASGSSQVVYDRAEGSRAFVVPSVEWGQSGLAVYDELIPAGDAPYSVTIVNPDSAEARTITLDANAQERRWATQGDMEYFVLNTEGSQITVLDPITGSVETVAGRLEQYSLTAADTSLGLSSIDGEWAVFGPDFNGGLGIGGHEYGATIAPDGQRIAFVTFEDFPFGGKAYVMDSFDSYPYTAAAIPGMDSARYGEPGAIYVFWGPVGTRIVE
ncbi:MAG: hypothetical protein K8J31_07000 [Anaerolineae bacterium]|nr:hypothetical protein [Anaerolineae bacterium]